MKYKIGDKVKIKTWKRLVKEFGFRSKDCIDTLYGFIEDMEEELNKLNCDRNLTIKNIMTYDRYSPHCYRMEEIRWNWEDEVIECLVENYVMPIPIENRWELLDL